MFGSFFTTREHDCFDVGLLCFFFLGGKTKNIYQQITEDSQSSSQIHQHQRSSSVTLMSLIVCAHIKGRCAQEVIG
jgi:hypothetical protein